MEMTRKGEIGGWTEKELSAHELFRSKGTFGTIFPYSSGVFGSQFRKRVDKPS